MGSDLQDIFQLAAKHFYGSPAHRTGTGIYQKFYEEIVQNLQSGVLVTDQGDRSNMVFCWPYDFLCKVLAFLLGKQHTTNTFAETGQARPQSPQHYGEAVPFN
jgi:hypothetical protein